MQCELFLPVTSLSSNTSKQFSFHTTAFLNKLKKYNSTPRSNKNSSFCHNDIMLKTRNFLKGVICQYLHHPNYQNEVNHVRIPRVIAINDLWAQESKTAANVSFAVAENYTLFNLNCAQSTTPGYRPMNIHQNFLIVGSPGSSKSMPLDTFADVQVLAFFCKIFLEISVHFSSFSQL